MARARAWRSWLEALPVDFPMTSTPDSAVVPTAPLGTITFLFTDVEGSTQLWEQEPVAMHDALPRHDAILRDAVRAHGGYVVKMTGDGMLAVFRAANDALVTAIDAQRTLHHEPWGETGPLKVRMGLHTGEAYLRDGDYYGQAPKTASPSWVAHLRARANEGAPNSKPVAARRAAATPGRNLARDRLVVG